MSTTTAPVHRRGLALALLAGPAVTLAGMAATPWEPQGEGSSSASYLATMADHPTRVQVSALLLAFGYALLGLAAFTVLRLARGVSPKLRVPALVLAFCSATLLPGMVAIDWVHLAVATELPREQGVRVFEAANDLGSFGLIRFPAIAGMVLGGLLVVCCAWRARLVGAWAPVAVVLGVAAAPLAGVVGVVAGSALTVLAYAGIAVGALRPRLAPVPAPQPVPSSSTLAA